MIRFIYFLTHKMTRQYNGIYIAPDRTKLEHVKHKKVVEEFKQRQAQGETDLIIQNGAVINKQPHCSNTAQGSDVQNAQSTDQSS